MPCPICHHATSHEFRPFCSRRCADVDLGNWMTGAYVLPGTDTDLPSGEPSDDADAAVDATGPGIRH